MTEPKFAVGDKVVLTERGRPYKVTTVTQIAKRYIACEDGTRWKQNGAPYPYEQYATARLEPMTEERRVELARAAAVRRYFHYTSRDNVEKLTTAQLNHVADNIKAFVELYDEREAAKPKE